MDLLNKKDIKPLLISLFLKDLNFNYLSNITQLDVHNWSFNSINTSKAFGFNNIKLKIKLKFADYEEYEELVTENFYQHIDTYFSERVGNIDLVTGVLDLELFTKLRNK